MTANGIQELAALVEAAFEDRDLLRDAKYSDAVLETIDLLDRGEVRVASPTESGDWEVHAFAKQAILLYFGLRQMERMEVGPFEFFDKIPLKKNLEAQGVRVVPPGTVRYGAHMQRGTVLMPGYVNIGAFVGEGTMVDTWATVGSCAQIGKGVHLSGGVGIGGVLEPPGAGHPRRHRERAGRDAGLRAAALGRHPRHAQEEVPRRRVRRPLRPHHRAPQRVHRQEGLAQRGAPRLRRERLIEPEGRGPGRVPRRVALSTRWRSLAAR